MVRDCLSMQPPTGFLALCEDNLPTPAIADPGEHFKCVLYTGDGSARGVTGVGFKPDFVWIKNRDGAYQHQVYDSVRGLDKNYYLQTLMQNQQILLMFLEDLLIVMDLVLLVEMIIL